MKLMLVMVTASLSLILVFILGAMASRHEVWPTPQLFRAIKYVQRVAVPTYYYRRDFAQEPASSSSHCPKNPFVIVTGGQSNAANSISSRITVSSDASAYSFYNNRCWPLQDPIPGATGRRGSLWSLLGQSLAERLDRPVIIIGSAAGASTFFDWTNSRSGFLRRLKVTVNQAREHGINVDAILWVQGESDAKSKNTEQKYFEELSRLIAHMYTELELSERVPIFLFKSTICGASSHSPSIPLRNAIDRLSSNDDRVMLGPDLDRVAIDTRQLDGCHLSDTNRDLIVAETLDLIERAFSDFT